MQAILLLADATIHAQLYALCALNLLVYQPPNKNVARPSLDP